MEQEQEPVQLSKSEVRDIVRSDNRRKFIERLMQREYRSRVKTHKTQWAGWSARRKSDGTLYWVSAYRDATEPKPDKPKVGALVHLPEWWGAELFAERDLSDFDPNAPIVRRLTATDEYAPEPEGMPQTAAEFKEQLFADRMDFMQQAAVDKWRNNGQTVSWVLASDVRTKYTYRVYYPEGKADQADERRKQAH